MTGRKPIPRSQRPTAVMTVLSIVAVILAATTASGTDVTVTLVTGPENQTVSLEEKQILWKSPFGGWGVTAWPFGLRVDDTAILEYVPASQKLLTGSDAELDEPADEQVDELMVELTGQDKSVSVEELITFRLDRRASVTLDLAEGHHTLHPFGIEFTVAGDGTVASRDTRVRVDAETRRIEAVCHPVTFKMIAGKRSISGPLQIQCASTSLLGGLTRVFAEHDRQSDAKPGTAASAGFRRITLYLPASASGSVYEVNGVRFELDAEGQVKLAAGANASSPDGREIRLLLPAVKTPAVPATQPIGVSWFGVRENASISCSGKSVAARAGAGSAWLPVPARGKRSVSFGDFSVGVPGTDSGLPHLQMVWDAAKGVVWAIQTAPLAANPAARWSCRIRSMAGEAAAPAALTVRLEPLVGGSRAGGEMTLKAGADGIFAGALPEAPGLWCLRVAEAGGPLPAGHALGLVRIDGEAAPAAVSIFNFHNRGIACRGDSLDVLWSTKLPAGRQAAQWPVVLRGVGLETQIAKIAASGPADTGVFKLETAALAPGAYEVTVADSAVACYPMRFHVVQRELESDFEVSSFGPIVRPSQPYPGSPVLLYKNHEIGGPGLKPFRGDADASLDGALAGYAVAPAGPALEKFDQPTPKEKDLMAVAALGMRSMPPYPEMLSQEGYNPKHTLPEDLAQMRRRMALVVQPLADVPGLGGFGLGWHPKVWGFWEGQPRLDGHQGRRNEAANKWGSDRFAELMKKYDGESLPEDQKKELGRWLGGRSWGKILPSAFAEWFADARQMRPELTLHNTKPTGWGQNNVDYPPGAYEGLSHRDALDYSDYCIQAWQNFIIPPILGMGNQEGQKLSMSFMSHGGMRAEEIPIAFGAAGRGLDGFALSTSRSAQSENLLRIFERFGSWIAALDPLPDVAIYFNNDAGIRIALHDLARLRRPGMVVSPEDVLAGDLSRYKVLMLLGVKVFELPQIEKAVRDFEAKGDIVIKDQACGEDIPGRTLGLVYAKHNHGAWHLSSNGEWPFAVMWDGFKKDREKILEPIFAKIPQLPVTTPDATVIISPLAGKESILCFVINQTLVPTELEGRWRQYVVLPKIGELRVDKGWHIHDVLAGNAAAAKDTAQGQSVAMDFTRMEGALYLLTKREPKTMTIRTQRTAPDVLRLTGWLADADDKPLADPMPFEVTLQGPDGATLFHKFAALGPATALDVPVPALSGDAKLKLVAHDLVLGSTAVQSVEPAPPASVAARTTPDPARRGSPDPAETADRRSPQVPQAVRPSVTDGAGSGDPRTAEATPDLIGGPGKIKAFLSERKGPVTVILDEEQDMFRPAAEKAAALLKKSGREARVVTWDLADLRPLHLRWKLQKEDVEVTESLKDGNAWAWRIGLSSWAVEKYGFDDPRTGYDEYGPRLRHDADVVLFGAPTNHRALGQLRPYLRRTPTETYPAPGAFFVHYLWSPFQGGYDGLYLGCRDAAGADAAVACLSEVAVPAPASDPRPDAEPVIVRGGAPAPLESMVDGKFGTPIIDVAFSPSGNRVFVTTASFGDWFFTLSPSGEILQRQMPPVKDGFPNWWMWGRRNLRPVDDSSLRINLWDADYLYDFDKGWISQAPPPPRHYLPGPGNGGGPVVRASTRLEDNVRGITYLGGNDRVHALDQQGRLLWRFEDSEDSGNLLYPRGTFPRAVSGNGRVLLVAAFGVHRMLYASAMRNPSVMGIDATTGKLLWQRRGMVLNEGKVVALDDRFLVIDDDGSTHEIIAADGQEGAGLGALTGSADWVMQLPDRNAILIVENNHFDRQSRTARVYVRPTKGGSRSARVSRPRRWRPTGGLHAHTEPGDLRSHMVRGQETRAQREGGKDLDLTVPGRVSAVTLAPDKQSFVVATVCGWALCFASDGTLLWKAETPAGRIVRFSPDGRTVVIGADDGTVHWLNAADGQVQRIVDFNDSNVITGELFVRQQRMGDVPRDAARTVPPVPPEPSYLTKFEPATVSFGPNLAPPETIRGLLKPAKPNAADTAKPGYVGMLTGPLTLKFKVEAGTTYLVELLDALADPADHDPLLRLEVAVTDTGQYESKNLPYTARLPLGSYLSRHRTAFRADAAGEVKLTLRAVLPSKTAAKKRGRRAQDVWTYEKPAASEIPVLLGDVIVSAIRFPGRNLLLDGGPAAGSKPAGTLTCTGFPHRDGTNSPKIPFSRPDASLRMVNGVIANQDTAWAGAGGVDRAEVRVSFNKPQPLSAVVIYEDASGPVPGGKGVRETTTMRYAVSVRNAATGQWSPLGQVAANTQLINLFPCPSLNVDQILYVWAGRHDAVHRGRTDGAVRMAQIEAYADDILDLDDLLDVTDDDLKLEP